MSWDDDGYYDLSYAVHKCRCYYARMRDFYRGLHRLVLGATIFSASAAFGAVLGQWPQVAATLAAIVALAATLDYAFATEEAASLHHDLCKRFTHLAVMIEKWEPTPDNLKNARARRLEIEADEPSIKRLVDIWADGEEGRARGVAPADIPPLSWLQRHLGPIVTFGMPALERWHRARETQRAVDSV